jgi:zinc/manganese transport system substrate-binding protein
MRMQWLFAVALIFPAPPAVAALDVFACEPEWGALARELGGDRVSVYQATGALQDPHRIEARPSLIARARSADLVVCTGAELEAGWLPLVLRESGNARVQPGRSGYFEAAAFVPLLERPARLDRSEGDIHASGNPHIQGDPRNIGAVAAALARRLEDIDPPNGAFYRERARDFEARWGAALARWEALGATLRGMPVVLQHRDPYLTGWLGLVEAGILEPRPGLEPTTSHLAALAARLEKQPARMVLRPAYQPERAARWLSERARIPVVVLPFTVGGSERAADLFGLYEDTLERLLAVLKP